MAGAIGQSKNDARPRAREELLSNGGSKIVRLPRPAQGPDSANGPRARQRLAAVLTQLVERDVVPLLLSVYGASPGPVAGALRGGTVTEGPGADEFSLDAIVTFTDTLLKGAPDDALCVVARLRESGMTAETLCLQLLTGAARHLGALWVADRASFADVTHATGTLQRIFRELAPDVDVPGIEGPAAALLAPVPGEQHSFGTAMLAGFFRNAGWSVQSPTVRNATDLQRRVAANPYDLLGLSLGAEIHLTRLTRCIEVARRASSNPRLVVMVGGPIFAARPELAVEVGADATAPDAASALASAERLVRTGRA